METLWIALGLEVLECNVCEQFFYRKLTSTLENMARALQGFNISHDSSLSCLYPQSLNSIIPGFVLMAWKQIRLPLGRRGYREWLAHRHTLLERAEVLYVFDIQTNLLFVWVIQSFCNIMQSHRDPVKECLRQGSFHVRTFLGEGPLVTFVFSSHPVEKKKHEISINYWNYLAPAFH